VTRLLSYDLNLLWHACRGGLFVSLIVSCVVGLSDALFRMYFALPIVWLLLDMIVAITVLMACLAFIPLIWSADVYALFSRLCERMPSGAYFYIKPFLTKIVRVE
jgi:hypothetical protein